MDQATIDSIVAVLRLKDANKVESSIGKVVFREGVEAEVFRFDVSYTYDGLIGGLQCAASAHYLAADLKKGEVLGPETVRDLPLSESIFSRVKEQYTAFLRTRRVLDDDLLRTFIAERNLGYDHDHMEDVYAALPGITLEGLAQFHRARLAGHPLSCAIVGRTAELDMDFLESRGKVRMLPKEETFGY